MASVVRLVMLFTLVLISHALVAQDSSEKALAILDKVDNLWRGESSYSNLTMRVKTKNYQRELNMESWSLGDDFAFIRILSPIKEKGTVTLKSDVNIYTYLPKTDRTIRLTAGMMSGSWMGSHFTNDDLVKESKLSEDYLVEYEHSSQSELGEIYKLTLIPREESAVVWGKIEIEVYAHNYIPIRQYFYDEDAELIRVISFHDVKQMGDRLLPVRMHVVPEDEPDEYTEIIYRSIQFNVPIEKSFFSLANLRRR